MDGQRTRPSAAKPRDRRGIPAHRKRSRSATYDRTDSCNADSFAIRKMQGAAHFAESWESCPHVVEDRHADGYNGWCVGFLPTALWKLIAGLASAAIGQVVLTPAPPDRTHA